ncbi:MAG: hypothetical protein NTV80_12055 [Verrucomicrobia bacterium]|nr:hypothetical protein [Verrucomicrobiota bacterium]
MKLLVYHRDTEGRIWGPFTPGQTTELLNRGVLINDSEARPLHKEAWCPVAYVWGKKNFPKGLMAGWDDPDADQSTNEDLEHGDRQCEELALHMTQKKSVADQVLTVDPPPLPFDFDLHQLDVRGLAFHSWSCFDDPQPGIELRFEALDKSQVFLRCMPSPQSGQAQGEEASRELSMLRVNHATARRQDCALTADSPVEGPGKIEIPSGVELLHDVFTLKDQRPVFCAVHSSIEEWWAHTWACGALWEVEFFILASAVQKSQHWATFVMLLGLWPTPSETLTKAINSWKLDLPSPAIPSKLSSESLPARLQAMLMQVSDWAANKLRAGDGWTALLMVVDRDGKASATVYHEDNWEAAEKLARKELTKGHYSGSLMYVLARHVSWEVRGESDRHAILMQAEARDRSAPVLLNRFFTEADGAWEMMPKLFRKGAAKWSAYKRGA